MDPGMHQSRPDEGPSNRPELPLVTAVQHFNEELTMLQEAGLPLLRSLQIASQIEGNTQLKGVLEQVIIDVEGGSSLTEAMGIHEAVFPPAYRQLLAAGERSGSLDIALRKAGARLEPDRIKDSSPEAQLRNCTEELALLAASGASVKRWVQDVAEVQSDPRLRVALRSIGAAIAGGSSLSEAMEKHDTLFPRAYRTMVAAGEMGGVLDIAFQRIAEKLEWDKRIETTRTPEYTSVAVRKFANALGSYISLGVPILEALNLAKEGQSEEFAQAVGRIHDAVREGESFAGPMREIKLFDSVFVQFVDIGEETGDLDQVLLSFAKRSPISH